MKIRSEILLVSTSSFITRFKAMNSDVLSSLEASSLMHCLRLDRGATPQISCNKQEHS